MPAASYVRTSFLGGIWSKIMQGRTDRPDYPIAMNECLNSLPMEQGAWVRRPGTRFAYFTRGGQAGRVINFDFKQAQPYSMEFTPEFLRFRQAHRLVVTNDGQFVGAISSATPAEVTTFGNHGWVNNNQVIFPFVGSLISSQLLNRAFGIVVTAVNKFQLFDGVTGAPIDGTGLVASQVQRVLEIATPYPGTVWQSLRSIQADLPVTGGTTPGAVLLAPSIKPNVLTVLTPPTATLNATFSLAAIDFHDGPYFDPPGHGALATPSAKIGVIAITLSFNAYDNTRAYAKGDYVTSVAINYRSLTDANVGNTPAGSPSNWVAVSAGEVVGPNGFQVTDIGRLIRLFSEPAIWLSGTTYAAGDVVAYGGAGLDYAGATYWKSLVGGNIGNTPGTDLTKWALFPQGALWTWGRITTLSNVLAPAIGGNIGDMTAGGGLAAAFDGIFTQAAAAAAEKNATQSNFTTVVTSYVGKDYTATSDRVIQQAAVYPSNDQGFAFGQSGPGLPLTISITLNLRGKASAPVNSADGTLLGTSGAISNTTAPVTIVSTDQVTAWKFVWIEQITTFTNTVSGLSATNVIAEVSFVTPPGTGTATGVSVEIRGDALLYTTSIRTWRLGLYSDTTGYPTCGTWHEGRLWLSGVVPHRIDSSRSNDPFNFAPTNPDGSVPANAGISYTFNAPDVNPIFWMVPDLNGIICGTQKGEWLVQATSANVPLTPTTIQAHRNTTYNCANIEPRRTNLTLAVVQAFKKELLEYFADVYSGKFSAKDLAFTVKHLVKSGIQEIGYQQETIPILWARCGDGSLIGFTYGRTSLLSSQAPDYAAAHRHALGSGRIVESICIAGNTDGTLDALTMVTSDGTTRQVEVLTNFPTETDTLASAWLLDSAVAVQATFGFLPTVIPPYGGILLLGMTHLVGKQVSVFSAGLDVGQGEFGTAPVTYTVAADGSVTVPFGDGVSVGSGSGLFTAAQAQAALAAGQLIVGFTYNSDAQLVRPNAPADTGAREGPGFGKLRRSHKYAIMAVNSAGLSIGTDFAKLNPILFKNQVNVALGPLQTFTGVYKDTLQDDYTLDGMLAWRVSRPLPAIVAAVGAFIHAQDE